MRISTFTSAVLLTISLNAQQVITSVGDGLVTDPTKWDCVCIPTPGDSIYVQHAMILNFFFAYSSGVVQVDPTGSLTDAGGFSILLDGTGQFNNFGQATLTSLVNGTGSINNSSGAVITLAQILGNDGITVNNGTINGADSLLNSGEFTHTGEINGGLLFNDSSFTMISSVLNMNSIWNEAEFDMFGGTIDLTSDIYSDGEMNFQGSVQVGDSVYNAGPMSQSGNMMVLGSFLNGDDFGTGSLDVIGSIEIVNDFLSSADVSGTGNICVGEYSLNSGDWSGTFDFCDQTPATSTPPFIDLNTGTIGSNITWCDVACILSVDELDPIEFQIYPQPANEHIQIQTEDDRIKAITLIDISGKKLDVDVRLLGKRVVVAVGDLPSGLYILRLELMDGRMGTARISKF